MSGHIDITQWIITLGYVGLLLIVFAETGLFVGFIFPGDSLVFTAGILAAKGFFHIGILIPALIATAFLGYAVGYWFGAKLGSWLMQRRESFWFRKRYIEQAHAFYEKYGGTALIIGRLVPVVRTFAPIVAGMGKMSYRRYSWFNLWGAILWGGVLTFLGYIIGGLLPNANKYLIPILIVIVFLSILPAIWHFLKAKISTKD